MAKYTQIPADTFQRLQLNAGLLLSDFTPDTGAFDKTSIIGATSGGVSFEATPSYTDFGDDIDNCPKNMMELKRLESWEVVISGTMTTHDTAVAKKLIGAADVNGTVVTPRNDLDESDFFDLWWVGDYSDENGDTGGGFIAIKMLNALSTGGLKITSSDKAKGTFDFEFTAHYSNENPDTVPFIEYIKAGTAA